MLKWRVSLSLNRKGLQAGAPVFCFLQLHAKQRRSSYPPAHKHSTCQAFAAASLAVGISQIHLMLDKLYFGQAYSYTCAATKLFC